MTELEKNKAILETLKESSELFKNVQLLNNTIVYNNMAIDISNIDLEAVVNSMTELTPESLFNALSKKREEKTNNIENWEKVKEENPDMKSIVIFNNHNLNLDKQEEFINIRTSDGKNHLFKNVINLDIFNEYMKLKAIYGEDISPDLLAKNIEKWQLNELAVTPADKVIADPRINENIKNQVQEYINQYKDKNYINITVNPEADVIYINDELNPENSFIVTFTKDINNELVAVKHRNNVAQEKNQTINKDDENSVKEDEPTNIIEDSKKGTSNIDYENSEQIISDGEFRYLVSKGNFSEKEFKEIQKYYDNVKEMAKLNDPNLANNITVIEESITNLQLLKDQLSSEEQTVVDIGNALCEEYGKSMKMDKGQALTYRQNQGITTYVDNNDNSDGSDSFGYLNIVSIFITIAVVLIGLSVLVLHILS